MTVEEVKKAINNLNRGNAADTMRITAEHLVFAEDSILDPSCLLLNMIFQSGQVTDSMTDYEAWSSHTSLQEERYQHRL